MADKKKKKKNLLNTMMWPKKENNGVIEAVNSENTQPSQRMCCN